VDQQKNTMQNEAKLLLPKLQVGTLLLLLKYHRYANAAAATTTTTNITTSIFAYATTAIACTYVPAAVTNITTPSAHKF